MDWVRKTKRHNDKDNETKMVESLSRSLYWALSRVGLDNLPSSPCNTIGFVSLAKTNGTP